MIRSFFHLIFPEVCICCEQVLLDTEKHLCTICRYSLPILEDNQHPVMLKLAGRVKANVAYSFLKFNKLGAAQKLLHELKYAGNKEVAIYLGTLLALDIQSKKIELKADYLVPVPLHKAKLKERGYNQSEMIAQGISDVLHIPIKTDLLFKTKESESQTKRGRAARLVNAMDCYEAPNLPSEHGIAVAIVDDVVTTGATLEACCSCLEKCGVSGLSVLSLAVA